MLLLTIIADDLSILVALEFLFFSFLELFDSTSRYWAHIFDIDLDSLRIGKNRYEMKAHGVYNGLIALSILNAVFIETLQGTLLWVMLYVIFALIYKGISRWDASVIWKQGGVAIVAVILLMVSLK